MDKQQILATFSTLALSQGFYGRLLRDLYTLDEEARDRVLQPLEDMHFKGPMDLILYMECGA